jgi:hypothetical protein
VITFSPEEHWTSTLRSYARDFEDFKDLPDYCHREISDITYDDAEAGGEMTRWLIGRGYEQGEKWLEKPPKYFIEVKTTTGECKDVFYMSINQARHVGFCIVYSVLLDLFPLL